MFFCLSTSGKSKNPYEFLFGLILNIDDECYYTQIITHKIICARSFIVYVLSYLIISSRFFFFRYFLFIQWKRTSIVTAYMHRKVRSGHNFWKDGIANFCKVHTHYLLTGNIAGFAVDLFTRITDINYELPYSLFLLKNRLSFLYFSTKMFIQIYLNKKYFECFNAQFVFTLFEFDIVSVHCPVS